MNKYKALEVACEEYLSEHDGDIEKFKAFLARNNVGFGAAFYSSLSIQDKGVLEKSTVNCYYNKLPNGYNAIVESINYLKELKEV